MRWCRVWGVLGLLFWGSVAAACAPVVNVDTAGAGASGGQGGGTGSQGGAGTTTAQGGGGLTDTEDCLCFEPASDCAGDPGVCRLWACDPTVCCVTEVVPDGTPEPAQIEGDCHQSVCQAGAIVAALDDTDISDDANECTIDACVAGQPTHMPAALGTPCGAPGMVCDGTGSCVGCNVDADCVDQPGTGCDPTFHECIIVDCPDGVKNGQETDVDCGGPNSCGPCADGQTCNTAADCQSQICAASICIASTCVDGVANGAETDIDCGGPACDPCAAGKGCMINADCLSGMCAGVVCQ